MKKCPFCAEENPDEAGVCRSCGKALPAPELAPQESGKASVGNSITDTELAITSAEAKVQELVNYQKRLKLVGYIIMILLAVGALLSLQPSTVMNGVLLILLTGMVMVAHTILTRVSVKKMETSLTELEKLRKKQKSPKANRAGR